MRFILNFIFYGVLFYLIYLAFPDAFFTMVSWAHSLAEFIKDLYMQLAAKVHDWRTSRPGGPNPPDQALLFVSMWILAKINLQK
jgi:hypothetical protein